MAKDVRRRGFSAGGAGDAAFVCAADSRRMRGTPESFCDTG